MGFIIHHPQQSLWQPETTSLARDYGFKNITVPKFFFVLEIIVNEHKTTAVRIFNMDKTLQTATQKSEKTAAHKGLWPSPHVNKDRI
jgi:hypothetical protein